MADPFQYGFRYEVDALKVWIPTIHTRVLVELVTHSDIYLTKAKNEYQEGHIIIRYHEKENLMYREELKTRDHVEVSQIINIPNRVPVVKVDMRMQTGAKAELLLKDELTRNLSFGSTSRIQVVTGKGRGNEDMSSLKAVVYKVCAMKNLSNRVEVDHDNSGQMSIETNVLYYMEVKESRSFVST